MAFRSHIVGVVLDALHDFVKPTNGLHVRAIFTQAEEQSLMTAMNRTHQRYFTCAFCDIFLVEANRHRLIDRSDLQLKPVGKTIHGNISEFQARWRIGRCIDINLRCFLDSNDFILLMFAHH